MQDNWFFTTPIPTPRIVSFNLQGLSANKPDKKSQLRHKVKCDLIIELSKNADIINLQETKLDELDTSTLKYTLPHWNFFYNNLNSRSQGNMIIVSPQMGKHFNMTHKIITKGATHSLSFRHKGTNPFKRPDFISYNIYFPHTWPEKQDILKKIMKAQAHDYFFLSGDWNFIEKLEDSSSGSSHYSLPASFTEIWNKFKNELNLQEISQDLFTRYTKKIYI